ncbi:MAG: hypothetical protein V4552_02390 [Pseudomonadota bacterium]
MLAFIWLTLGLQVACSNSVSQDKATVTIKPVATLQEIMLSVIDPNVDPIWNSVSTVATKDGVVEKVPSTDEEWNVLKNHAIVLIEAANLLQIPNRAVAHAGSSTSIHPVELQPEEVEKLIQANRVDFNNKAINLQNAAKSALVAIKEKNPDALLQVGSQIEHACEQCHATYWYPNDKVPVAVNSLGLKSVNPTYVLLRNVPQS